MLAYVQFHAGMQRQHDQLARRVPRKCNSSRTGGDTDDERHTCEDAAHAALQGHHAHLSLIVLPEQDMMLEKDRVLRTEIYLRDRDDLALDLTSASTKTDLGHVLDPRRLSPAGFADQVLDVERRSAGPTRDRALFVHRLAPLTQDPLDRHVCSRDVLRWRLLRLSPGRRGHWGRVLDDVTAATAKTCSGRKLMTTRWTIAHLIISAGWLPYTPRLYRFA